ncbi:hypothetical protein HK104_003483 [Borealophlyctis nickersoniae]|nr:hypothetical protein HK104_003483 [Borealophlyctis nickersoniae]
MGEIAEATFHQRDFLEIMEMIDKRLNDHGKNWRHVFKALTLLDYLLRCGSEAVISYARENLYIIKTLKEFQFIDEEGKDQGANVRQKCKDITALLSDEERLREERQKRYDMRGRIGGLGDEGPYGHRGAGPYDGEDRELQKAIEESKRTAQQEIAKRLGEQEDAELQKALEISEREAIERRMKERDAMLQNQTTGNSTTGGGDLVDFFGGIDDSQAQQQNFNQGYDPFSGFGNPDPFAAQQQAQQQQFLLQQQQLQQQQNALQQQLLQQNLAQQQMAQQQLMSQQQQQNNPFGGLGGSQQGFGGGAAANPFGMPAAAPSMGNQLTGDASRLVSSNATIDPFASLAATRSGASSVVPNMSTGGGVGSGQFNPFGGGNSQGMNGNSDPFAALGSSRQQPLSTHTTGGDMVGFGSPRQQPISTHNTGPASFGGFGGLGGNQASSSGGGFGNAFGGPSNATGGSGVSEFLGLPSAAKPQSNLVNLDLLGGGTSSGGNNSGNAFGAAAAKNPFQSTGSSNASGGNKFQWEQPKQQPTLAQMSMQQTSGRGSPFGVGAAGAGSSAGFGAGGGGFGAQPFGQSSGFQPMQQAGFGQQAQQQAPFGQAGGGGPFGNQFGGQAQQGQASPFF